MRTTKWLMLAIFLGALGGCGGPEHVIAKEHKARAEDMCKHDKGLKEVMDAYGAHFTAKCQSGIIVAGVAQL
jgi:hypothetical protein